MTAGGAVAGIDSSTQSCKVQIRRADDGALLGEGRAAHPPTTPPRSEQDPSAWWDALGLAFAAARAAAGDPSISAMAVAGQQHGLVALDADDEVLRPAKLWNDTESAADARWLLDQLEGGATAWALACGSVPVASFTITKLSWLHRSEPAAWERLARVALPHDWLTHRLAGAFVTDRGDASGTGYWSPADEAYRWDLLAIIDDARDWRTAVPEVHHAGEVAGRLTADAAAALGYDGQLPLVAVGTGDNMAAAVGLGLRPGELAVSIGTSGTVYTVADRPVSDPTGAVAGFADAGRRYLPLVCTLNAALVTEAMASWTGRTLAELDDDALRTPAGAAGVVLLPYLAGERTPDRPDATGALTGLRADTRPEHLARAAFEGVVCGLLDGVDALTEAGVVTGADSSIRLIGGGGRSPAYRQILADLSGRPVVAPGHDEHVAAGACAVAAAALLGADPVEIASTWALAAGPTTEPEPGVERAAVRHAYAVARDQG